MLKQWIKKLIYWVWVLCGYWGWQVQSAFPAKVTVLITYYNPARLKHIDHQVRNLLKCTFIERVILSSHNPAIQIENQVTCTDRRLVFVNQATRRGCGYRWSVARDFPAQYLIVIDDDLLLFPWQVRQLLAALVAEPVMPHGFAGMVIQPDGSLDYHQKENRRVDYLCEIYAITGQQLQQYHQIWDQIGVNPPVARSVEQTADFILISRAGIEKPKIHHAGHLLRCPTFNQAGVAIHRKKAFLEDIQVVSSAIASVLF